MQSPTIERLIRGFALSQEAANKSPRTIEGYLESVRLFDTWLASHSLSTVVVDIRRDHVEGFMADQLARLRPSSAATRYKGLRVFFGWCVEEEELAVSPMAKMRPPIIPEEPVDVLTDDEVRALLKVCSGKSFEDRRDNAVIRVLYDCGLRRAELAGLRTTDVDLDLRVVVVLGKGRRPRAVPFGANTARGLERYDRLRSGHPLAGTPALWLGTSSRTFGAAGVRQMLERRGQEAGVSHVHAHRFRHGFAHAFLSEGGNEGDLMVLTGWRSRQMLNRYGASVAAERARSNYSSPGDRL